MSTGGAEFRKVGFRRSPEERDDLREVVFLTSDTGANKVRAREVDLREAELGEREFRELASGTEEL